jgi:Uma2 family endonuclease
MAFMIDEAYLPVTLSSPPMTDEEFLQLCAEYPDFRIEATAEGEIIIMAPTHPLTGDSNSGIVYQLVHWSRQDGRGRTYDSSSGFVLPNGARRSPDASWILKSRIMQIEPSKREGFWHLCPDFVIELKSGSDRLPSLKKKMREYMDNGAQLGWLLNPQSRSVMIYRPNREPETRSDILYIEGEGPVAGFVLDLAEIWDPFGK